MRVTVIERRRRRWFGAVLGWVLAVVPGALPAAAEIELPRTIAWSAYNLGTTGVQPVRGDR